ncbi:hypothetical protein DS745_20840 [Anaerobacillus alkaliphilus]|uniref:Uncharacterized protein n=1 Tax=Anaerobacillus alkaliphilus TaxID=1548597 RepID=A0A4Q0VN12_9BACI|nr:hypothetical protein [Anaerobacillus alkaliphilus]RXI96192.1 hypothetical protein DS745_20840 [Anaerobacillus alkaliphilus]
MKSLLIFIYDYLDFDLVALLITVALIVWGLGVKVRSMFSARMVLVFLIIFLIVNHMQYTTFERKIAKKINEATEVRELTISFNDPDKQRKGQVTIEDEETIERILEDFKFLKLKRVVRGESSDPSSKLSVNLTFTISTWMDLNYNLTESYRFNADERFLNGYKILGRTNHFKTIKELIESEEVEWE